MKGASKSDIKNNKNKVTDNDEETVDEPWRSKKEWWKDPLALFDDNDELIDPLDKKDAVATVASKTETEVDDDFVLPVDEPPTTNSIKIVQQQVAETLTTKENSNSPTVGQAQQFLPIPLENGDAAPSAQVEVHPIPQERQQPPVPPLGPNLESAVITQHSFDSVPSSASTAVPAVSSPAADPMAVLPAVSTTMTALPSNFNAYANGLNVGSMLSNLPAVKMLAILAVGKAIITGISLSPPGVPTSDGDLDLPSSSSSGRNTNNSKKNTDNSSKSSRRSNRDSDIAAATAATNSMLLSSSSSSQGWTRQLTTWFGLRRRSDDEDEKLPSARELMDEVEVLRKRAETAEQERQVMEREYEKTSWQLQEAQNELSSLTSTTRYLKAQLRDNEEMMDRAIRAERRKAKEELLRLKDAMLEVVERERQAMRDELTRQAEEVQNLLRDGVSKNSYPA